MTDNLMGDLYRVATGRHQPDTIQRHETRLVAALYVRVEALRAGAKRLKSRERPRLISRTGLVKTHDPWEPYL